MSRNLFSARVTTIVSLAMLYSSAAAVVDASIAQESNDTQGKHHAAVEPPERPSEAERIAGLKRTIEAEEERLRELSNELNDPESEYNNAERDFQRLDGLLEQKREALEKFTAQGDTSEAERTEREIKSLEKEWRLAKDRFDLAIEERKTLREEIATLTRKIEKDREALHELTGVVKDFDARSDRDADGSSTSGAKRTKAEANDDVAPAGKDRAPSGETSGEDPPESAAPESPGSSSSDESRPEMDAELVAAEVEAKEKTEQAEQAQEQVQSIAARIADLQKLIAQEQKSLALTRKQADLASATQRALEDELSRRTTDGATLAELDDLRRRIRDAADRLLHAKSDVIAATERLNENHSELAALQSQQIIALQEAETKRLEAQAAQEKVAELRNPFAPRNILQWLLDHGPRLIIMFVGMIVVLQCAKLFSNRTIKLVARGTGRGSADERENRARTLVGVFQNAVSVAIVVGGILMMLDEIGVKVTVLLGGMAVAGLAVAFGAQSLIKDYFYGFVMLLENQYMINDVVRIGEFAGQVERITLRLTVLRDANGVVHFIPNGQINSVSNETHGWSRAVIEVGVAYQEDAGRVIDVLTELNREFRSDPAFGPLTLDDATTPAVDSLGESAVVIKYAIKTRPAQQTAVRRELLRRIKARFDSLGIEIPFPQRTVYHRYEEGVVPPQVEIKRVA